MIECVFTQINKKHQKCDKPITEILTYARQQNVYIRLGLGFTSLPPPVAHRGLLVRIRRQYTHAKYIWCACVCVHKRERYVWETCFGLLLLVSAQHSTAADALCENRRGRDHDRRSFWLKWCGSLGSLFLTTKYE